MCIIKTSIGVEKSLLVAEKISKMYPLEYSTDRLYHVFSDLSIYCLHIFDGKLHTNQTTAEQGGVLQGVSNSYSITGPVLKEQMHLDITSLLLGVVSGSLTWLIACLPGSSGWQLYLSE